MGESNHCANKGKHIVVVIDSWLKKHGSFEDYLVALAAEAQSSFSKITFILPGVGAEQITQALLKAGAAVFVADRSWNTDHGRGQISRLLQKAQPALVNFHFCDPKGFSILFFKCWVKRIPVVFHYHGEIRPLDTLTWKNRYFSALRLTSVFWKRIVTVSHANEHFLRALRVRCPIDVVYNGIDVPRFVKLFEEQEPPQDNGHIRCLYIGSLNQRKRVDVLLSAFSVVCSKLPLVELTIVGGGDLESALKRYAKDHNLDGAVDFKGLLLDYPFDLLASCDLFVSASESESFGLVFAEAMAFKRPVVACRTGGIPEVVADGKTGKLVRVNDAEELASAVIALATNPRLRHEMGENARTAVASQFQLDTCIAATIKVFEEVAESPTRSRLPR